MSQQPAALFPAPPAPAAEPDWLRDARRRNAPYAATADDDFSPSVLDRRALLKGYDALAARVSALQVELAEQEREKLALVQENEALRAKHPNQAQVDEVLEQLRARLHPTPAPALVAVEPAVEPILTGGHPSAAQQKALRECAPAVGSIWQKKADPTEQVIICESSRWDSVALRAHPPYANSDFNRLRHKKEHYFLGEYEPVASLAVAETAAAAATPLGGRKEGQNG